MTFFALFFLIIMAGCKTTEIPFEFDTEKNRIPTVKLTFPCISENIHKNTDMLFGIDTGCQISCFRNNAEKKLFASEEDFYDCFQKACEDGGLTIENFKDKEVELIIPEVECGKYIFPELHILATSDNHERLDGLLGYEAFKDLGVILFDFKKNVLIFGKRKVNKNILPMKKENFFVGSTETILYSIPIEIDGKIYDCIIDTGFSSKGDLFILTASSINLPNTFSVKIGSVLFENVEQAKVAKAKFFSKRTTDNAEELFKTRFILGNAFFQNHRIQLDFENMTFAMD